MSLLVTEFLQLFGEVDFFPPILHLKVESGGGEVESHFQLSTSEFRFKVQNFLFLT